MAQVVRLESGLLAHRLSKSEQNIILNEISINTSPVGKHSLFTPQDNIEYFIISEKELSNDNLILTIKSNNKTFNVKCNIYNQDEKIYSSVRKNNK